MCVRNPRNRPEFSGTIDLRGHMPRFTQKMNISHLPSLGNPINVCWNPQNMACFSQMIDLMGHMPRYTLKMKVFPSNLLGSLHKCVLKPSEQGPIIEDDWFEGSHALVYSQNEHFPISSLWKPHKLCVESHRTGLVFLRQIDLRGHMPRFTLKINIFPIYLLGNLQKCVLKPSEQALIFWDRLICGVTCLGLLSKNEQFSHLISLETSINVCRNPQNRAHVFLRQLILRAHMPRFTQKMNIF